MDVKDAISVIDQAGDARTLLMPRKVLFRNVTIFARGAHFDRTIYNDIRWVY